IGDERHAHGPRHDEREARVPVSGHVEKADDLGRLHHARKREADTEEQPREQGGDVLLHHETPSRWRTTNTVTTPVSTKLRVATSARGDRRPSPHTPWPLVQPPLMRVPKPTRNPPSTSRPRGKPVRGP